MKYNIIVEREIIRQWEKTVTHRLEAETPRSYYNGRDKTIKTSYPTIQDIERTQGLTTFRIGDDLPISTAARP